MALTSLNDIKNWFRTNFTPTQNQFWDLLDSFRHKNDKVAATDVDGLSTLLAALRTWVNEQIAGFVVGSTLIDGVTLTSVLPATGNVHTIVLAPGTYVNWNNIVVPANTIAILKRFNGVFSVSMTAFDVSGKVSFSDVINNLTSTSATSPLSANQGRALKQLIDEKPNTPVVDGFASNSTTSAGSANNDRLLDEKINNIIKDTDEDGAFFTNELGEVFIRFNADGVDFSKVSSSLKAKIITVVQEIGTSVTSVMSQDGVTKALSDIQTTKETEEDGAFLCNENGEVFFKFNAGVSEIIGFENESQQPVINNLEDIANVGGAITGQYLKKLADGSWIGALPPVSEPTFNQLNLIARSIVTDGLVQMDARANHPMYGKNFFVFGDSHATSGFRFYSRIAEATGATYYELSIKNVLVGVINEPHIFIRKLSSIDYVTYVNEIDTGVLPNCDGANNSQLAHIIYLYCQSNNISLDYIIVANSHFDTWNFYNTDGTIKEFPPMVFLNPTKVFSRLFNNSAAAHAFFSTNIGITEIVNECAFNTVDSTVKVRFGTAGQTLNFSFSTGNTLNVNTVAKINFGTNVVNSISTTLTAGMTIEQCVDAINQWAFQEYSTWINANKGVFGGSNIALTYSSVVGGDSTGVAVLTSTPSSNLRMSVPIISTVSSAFTLQYCSKSIAGLRVATNWLTSGGNVDWAKPHTTIGAMQYIGKLSPFTKWVFLGIWNNALAITDVYPDGTVNPYLLLNKPSYIFGQISKQSSKNVVDLFGGQYIDVDKLSGINAFNVTPTFNPNNDVHLQQAGYIRSVDTIVRNIK